jgi:hypothetical protein
MKENGSGASPSGNLRAKILRLFGGNMGFESSHAGNEIAVEGNNHYYLPGEARSALLDAEYKKATAIMEMERQQRFC